MLSKFFQSRLAVAAAASVAVVALMAVSVGTVQAVVAQDQQETEDAKRSEEQLRRASILQLHTLMESKLHSAKQALAARERGAQVRLHLVRELQHARVPRVEFRGMHGSFGGSMADRVLAMAEEIELTEEQEARIRGARRDQRRAEIERDAQIDVVDLDLDELLEDRHTADLDAVEELMQRRASLRVQAQIADMRASQDVWNSLTSEQREKLEKDRHGVFMLRRNSPRSLYFDGHGMDFALDGREFEFSDFDLGAFNFGKFFTERHLEALEGLFELKSDDGAPFILRFGRHSDDDKDGEDKDKGTTEGAAIGISWAGQSIRTMN